MAYIVKQSLYFRGKKKKGNIMADNIKDLMKKEYLSGKEIGEILVQSFLYDLLFHYYNENNIKEREDIVSVSQEYFENITDKMPISDYKIYGSYLKVREIINELYSLSVTSYYAFFTGILTYSRLLDDQALCEKNLYLFDQFPYYITSKKYEELCKKNGTEQLRIEDLLKEFNPGKEIKDYSCYNRILNYGFAIIPINLDTPKERKTDYFKKLDKEEEKALKENIKYFIENEILKANAINQIFNIILEVYDIPNIINFIADLKDYEKEVNKLEEDKEILLNLVYGNETLKASKRLYINKHFKTLNMNHKLSDKKVLEIKKELQKDLFSSENYDYLSHIIKTMDKAVEEGVKYEKA